MDPMKFWKEPLAAKPEETAHASAEKFNVAVTQVIATATKEKPLTLQVIRDAVLIESVRQGLPSPATLWMIDDCNNTVGFICRTDHPDGTRVGILIERKSESNYDIGVVMETKKS